MAAKLTERVIEALAPPRRGSRLIWDTKLTGLALRLYAPTKAHPKGARTFLLSYWQNGTESRLRIGSWPDWSVSAARAEARKLRRRVDRGEDPAGDRRKRREVPTKAEQSQHVVDVHHAITESSLSLKPMRDQAQDSSCKGVERNPEQAKERFLSPVEIALFFDPRIRGVWKKLYRQRADGTFLYPTRDAWWERPMFFRPAGGPSAADARERQVEAMVELLDTALVCQLTPLATTTRREAEQQRDRYLDKARELERDALTMVANSACFAHKRDEHWRRLRDHDLSRLCR
jgi:hypothetical protein